MAESAPAGKTKLVIRNIGQILSGRIDYLDSSQNRHTTTACMIYVPGSSGFGACREGNRLD